MLVITFSILTTQYHVAMAPIKPNFEKPVYQKIVYDVEKEYPSHAVTPRLPFHQYTECTPGCVNSILSLRFNIFTC
jgi:hypothetical protein